MQVTVIKKLVEEASFTELEESELALLEELPPTIEIEGKDDGERLTHIMAAIWIKKDMVKNDIDFRTSMRNFSQKVRKSIS